MGPGAAPIPAATNTAVAAVPGAKQAGHDEPKIMPAVVKAVQQLQPAITVIGDSSLVHQTAVQAPAAAATTAQPSSTAAATPVIAEHDLELPTDFLLKGCDHNLLAAGEQLTQLLDILQAPDQQLDQLYQCINKLRGHNVAPDKVNLFWFEYSQLQSWVNRRKVNKVKYAMEQLLSLA